MSIIPFVPLKRSAAGLAAFPTKRISPPFAQRPLNNRRTPECQMALPSPGIAGVFYVFLQRLRKSGRRAMNPIMVFRAKCSYLDASAVLVGIFRTGFSINGRFFRTGRQRLPIAGHASLSCAPNGPFPIHASLLIWVPAFFRTRSCCIRLLAALRDIPFVR